MQILLIQNEILNFFLILIGSAVFAKLFHFCLVNYVKKIADKTKSDLDNIILKIITKPLYELIIFIGLWFAVKDLSFVKQYALWIDKIFFIGSILIITLIASKVLNVLISRLLKVQKKFEKTPKLISKVTNIIIYLAALLIVLQHYNVEITPLVAGLGIGGLAVGLALQSTLSNFFAGVHLISDRPVSVGDFIELGSGASGFSGFVEDIGWRTTKIKTIANNIIIIPNSKLADSIITNVSYPQKEMGVIVQCGVAYDSDLEKVEKVTLETANKIQQIVPGAVKDFEPSMKYHTFGDSNIQFSIILRVAQRTNKYTIVHHFIKALKSRYDQEGIEISWPVRKVYYGNNPKS